MRAGDERQGGLRDQAKLQIFTMMVVCSIFWASEPREPSSLRETAELEKTFFNSPLLIELRGLR